ncbi:hypothetical protein JTB14_029000 [Gonioctena quinquepunctata]|nr:hypothetical protein JTB14_029000 [Gonioctena quinquepunctata]
MNNITYSNEVVSLKNTLTHLQSSKENPIRELTSSTTKVSERKKLAFINTPSHSCIRKKILIVSTVHGKGMAEAMSKLTEEYSILSFVKPHATDAELVVTATNLARDFTKDDVVLIWPNRLTSNSLDNIRSNLKNTYTIIISEPYRLNGNINQLIYENNLLINKKLHAQNTNQCLFLECNNILRRSNYYGDGIRLTNAAKFFLGKALLSLVKGLPTSGNCESEQPEFKNNQIHIICKNCNISNETNIDVYPEAEEIENLKREVQSQCDTITKMRLEHTLFYNEAIEMENNFLKEREHLQNNICELEVVIKTLTDKETIESRSPVFIDANTQTSAKTVESEKTVKQRVNNASTQTANITTLLPKPNISPETPELKYGMTNRERLQHKTKKNVVAKYGVLTELLDSC